MNKILFILSLFFQPLWASLCAHTSEQMTFRNIDVPGSSVVLSFAQDEEGMMWLGTLADGLYYYDGYGCYSSAMPDSLRCSVYNMVAEGDSIYMGTEQGLLIYDRKTRGCHKPSQSNTTDARAIVRHGERFLIGTKHGVFAYNPLVGSTEPVCLQISHVYSMALWGDDLLVATINGLYQVHDGSAHEIAVENRKQEYVSIVVPDLLVEGKYWIGGYGQLFSYEPRSGRFIRERRLNNSSVKSIGQDQSGRLFVGTDNGLYVLDSSGVTRYMHDYIDARSIGNNIIWSTFVDRSDHLWLGTDTGFSHSGEHPDFHFIPVMDLTDSSSGNYLTTLFEDNRQTLWVGGSSGLIRYPLNKNCLWYQVSNSSASITHNRIRSIWQDSENDIWICSDYGINHLAPNGKLSNFTLADSTKSHIARWIYGVVEDYTGRLWIASYDGGVMVVGKRQLKEALDNPVIAEYNLLPQEHISKLLVDSHGDIWIGSSKGLYVARPTTMELRLLSPYKVQGMTMDSIGRVWVAGRDRLCSYAHADASPEMVSLSTDEADIVGLISVNQNIWILTESECRVLYPDGSVHLFYVPDFKITSAYYAPSSQKVYLGGNDAMLTVDPTYTMQGQCYPLMLSNLLVGGKDILSDIQDSNRHPIRLPYPENSFTLKFTDLPYLNRRASVYAYRLAGADERWHKIDPSTMSVSFNALSYGRYHLQVCAMDGRGVPNQTVWERDMMILPPWYLSVWMKLFYLICTIIMIGLVIRVYRVKRRLKDEQMAKERVISESQRRIQFYRSLYDDILTSIHGILSPMEQLSTRLQSADKKALCQVRQEVHAINTLVWDACASISDEVHPIRPATSIDMVTICQQMVEDVHRRCNSVQRPIIFSSEVIRAIIYADYPGADMALSKILRFVLTHRPDDARVKLHLSIADDSRSLLISVSVQSLHIAEEIRPYLLQRYALPGDGTPSETYASLFQVRLWVEQQGGSIYLIPGREGDIFQLTLPLSEEPLPVSHEEREAEETEIHPLSSTSQPNQPSESDERLLREIIQIIGDHLDDRELNVCRLQQLLGIGDKMLYRKIKMMTGMTPVEYIRDIRMKRAAVLLRGGQFSVAEVMYMVGFSNSGYFSKCFQRTFGVTPTNYR